MNYTVASLINLLTLLIGIAVGLGISPYSDRVSAQANQPPACVPSSTVDCVTPLMTVGSAGIGKLLANQITADQVTVNGYDILKLDDKILAVLINAKIITTEQAHALVDEAKPDKQLRYQAPPSPSPAAK